MSEMVERVARAMAENAGFCWENCAQSQWESDARAGIEAMRELTPAMWDAMARSYQSPACMWMAAIDEARK